MLCRPFQRIAFLLVFLASARSATNGAAETGAPRSPLQHSSAPTLQHSNTPSSFTEYRVTRWTAENGLPQNSIKALLQPRDGYLWIGTLNGLVQFDGVRFTVFDHNNTPEIMHDSVNELVEDTRDGGLWIGTGSGLLYYRDHRFQRFGEEHGVSAAAGRLRAAREGGVWFYPRLGQVALARDGKVQIWDFGANTVENTV